MNELEIKKFKMNEVRRMRISRALKRAWKRKRGVVKAKVRRYNKRSLTVIKKYLIDKAIKEALVKYNKIKLLIK